MAPQNSPMFSDFCADIMFIIAGHLDAVREKHETPVKYLSLVNRSLRNVTIPILFRKIHINQPIYHLSPTPLIQHAHTCKIDMFGSKWWWCSGAYVSSKDAMDLFHCIQKLKGLKTLEVSMMSRS